MHRNCGGSHERPRTLKCRLNVASGPRRGGAHPRRSRAHQARRAPARGHSGGSCGVHCSKRRGRNDLGHQSDRGGVGGRSVGRRLSFTVGLEGTCSAAGGGAAAALSRRARRGRPGSQPSHAAAESRGAEEPRPKALPPEFGVAKWSATRRKQRNGQRPDRERAGGKRGRGGEHAPSPALDSLDPELTVLRQAQEDLRAGLPAPGPAPVGRIRPPLWQGNAQRRKASHRGHCPLSGAPRPRGSGPGRTLFARRPAVAPGRARAFCVPEVRRNRKTVQRN